MEQFYCSSVVGWQTVNNDKPLHYWRIYIPQTDWEQFKYTEHIQSEQKEQSLSGKMQNDRFVGKMGEREKQTWCLFLRI